jgi:hypothetical protein
MIPQHLDTLSNESIEIISEKTINRFTDLFLPSYETSSGRLRCQSFEPKLPQHHEPTVSIEDTSYK